MGSRHCINKNGAEAPSDPAHNRESTCVAVWTIAFLCFVFFWEGGGADLSVVVLVVEKKPLHCEAWLNVKVQCKNTFAV